MYFYEYFTAEKIISITTNLIYVQKQKRILPSSQISIAYAIQGLLAAELQRLQDINVIPPFNT